MRFTTLTGGDPENGRAQYVSDPFWDNTIEGDSAVDAIAKDIAQAGLTPAEQAEQAVTGSNPFGLVVVNLDQPEVTLVQVEFDPNEPEAKVTIAETSNLSNIFDLAIATRGV